ncbi:MAG: YceI family protein [Alphaproteobacteria bacterium]|nr:YceI family protein [Alphaproteobacteria bacterium]
MKTKLFILVLLGIMLTGPAKAEPVRYYIPPGQLNVAFQIMDRGVSNILGMFPNATGSFVFDPVKKTVSNVKVAIETSSIMTANPSALPELRDLFAARDYPEISFVAASPVAFEKDNNDLRISGHMSMHGQNKPATFTMTFNNYEADSSPKGQAAMGFSARATIQRAEFDMSDPPEMPSRFGESITFQLEGEAIRQ